MSKPNVTTTTVPRGARTDQAFRVINQMVTDHVIESYAIGGATAAFFYIEPDTTFDIDIFCVLTGIKADAIDMLSPIYEYLRPKGYGEHATQGEAVDIEGVAVQFLPVYNDLNAEAVEDAREFDFAGVTVKVMSPEHLVAIMLQTGRAKDYVRVARFLESDAFDMDSLIRTLTRHKLDREWAALKILQRRIVK